MSTVSLSREQHIGIMTMDASPVNSLGPVLRSDLMDALTRCADDSGVRAIVIRSGLKVFSAGADINEFVHGELARPSLNDVCNAIEALDKPVVALIEGAALGGGLELALACHGRVAGSSAQMGLPEVKLGLLPGAGGTQRLARLVPVAEAVTMIMEGKTIAAGQAHEAGLACRLADNDALVVAIELARELADAPLLPTRLRQVPPLDDVDAIAARIKPDRAFAVARSAIVQAIKAAGTSKTFDAGLAVEWEAFERLLASAESQALRHLFFAERNAAKIPDMEAAVLPRPVARVAIVGAGTMGSGIAINFLACGLPVRLIDVSQEAVERGVQHVRSTLAAAVTKGRLTQQACDHQLSILTPSVGYGDIAQDDLIIEAVYESMALKQQIWAAIGKLAKPAAVLATNTSTLDVDVIAQSSNRPGDFLGMHFFSPANIMKLLEVVRGKCTDPAVLATALAVGKRIGKTSVVSGVCYGFIGNRMLEGYLRETDAMLLEGASPSQIDQALEAFGMAMGPCRMMDMSGVDVNANVLEQRELAGELPSDPAYRVVCRTLHGMGRLGQKSGQGYYAYEGRKAVDDPAVQTHIKALAARLGVPQTESFTDEEIVMRCLAPLINEGFRILDEGIAYRAGDIDVVWTSGYGFPRWRGGPMFYASQIGADAVLATCRQYAARSPESAGGWQAADGLVRAAGQTGSSHSTQQDK